MRISDWSSDVCSSDLIALPGLPSLIRRAVALSMPLSAPVLLADGPNNVTYWARVVPDGEEADLQLFDWNGTGGAMEQALEGAVRERDVRRASAARAEGRRGGKEWGRTCRSRGSTKKEKKQKG